MALVAGIVSRVPGGLSVFEAVVATTLPVELPGAAVPATLLAYRAVYYIIPLFGDKSFLFAAAGDGFVMYAVEGRSWIGMGDPVGPPETQREPLWNFRNLVDRYDGWPVFYEVRAENLPLYLDLGLTLLKLGEEAVIPLEPFSLEGGARKGLRAYKDKFNPVWEPRYLASPAGLALPRILANLATLISGCVRGVFGK